MTAKILDGRPIASEILASVSDRAGSLSDRGVQAALVFVSIGQSDPGQMYVSRLEKQAGRTGIAASRRELPEDISLRELDRTVAELNADDNVDGIIVQMPLPQHLTFADLSKIIDPRKDVDGITVENGGRLYLGLSGRFPSTAVAMMEILAHEGIDPLGKRAVVVGRSNVVGHPLAELLLRRSATVTITHSRTRDLGSVTREAEILMAAVGRPHLIKRDMVREGAVIVDAGINVTEDGIKGDVDFEDVLEIAAAVTPVPGGVGPVNNAVLLRNVVDSAEERIA